MRNLPAPAGNAYALLIVTALIWGGNSVAGKLAVGHISPLLLTTLRWAVAFAAMLAYSLPELKRDWQVLMRQWYIPVLLGVTGYTAFNAFLYSALQYTSAINAVILQAGIPAIIFIMNFVFFRIRASVAQVLGFLVTLCGVLLAVARGDIATLLGLSFNKGDILMLGGVAVYAVYTVGLRWRPKVHWKSMITFAFGGALIACLPLAAGEYVAGDMILPDVQGWLVVAYAAIFASLVSQSTYLRGVELIGANRAGLFVNLVPIFGTLLAVVIAGEQFHLYHFFSLALVLGGIAYAERSGRR